MARLSGLPLTPIYLPAFAKTLTCSKNGVRSQGAYASGRFRLSSRLYATLTERHEVFNQQGRTRVFASPRLALRWAPSDAVAIDAAAGRYAQAASLPLAVPGFRGFGLGDFGLQTSTQGSLGAAYAVKNLLSASVTGFVQRFRVSDLRDQFTLDPQREILVMREGRSYGVEVLVRRPAHRKIYGWLSYTLSKSERVLAEAYNSRAPSDWDQRHVLSLVTGYRFEGGTSVGVRVHYNTGRVYPVGDEDGGVEYLRLPGFFQLDLRADWQFLFDSRTLFFYAEFINATFSEQVVDLQRNDFGELEPLKFGLVLPSLGFRAQW